MADCGHRQPTYAVVAYGTISEQLACRAHKAVVVQRGHNGQPLAVSSAENRGAEQGEGVVNVHHVGPALAKGAKKFRVRLRAPHNLPGEEHPSWRPPVFDLLAKSLEPLHSVAV
jgi:hypothetical protein